MKQILVALFAGALFGAGLAFSGMADPARVQGFLDIFGHWDPTLAFVMGGAMIPMAVAWIIQRRLDKPFADAHFSLPDTSLIDRKLTIGAVLFGVGWGISGLCPGPGLADLAINPLPALAFVIALFAGMIAHRVTS
ncbi:MAG: YeeE/YedE family protein [Sphingomonadales bacterium]|nr:YeeE/YedE family protein [Sphingomonadales bacterium]NCO49807.1 YeeE/YedE family protein [Sphingomonadales bacterium]NCP00688.1 YeeE/YedE family protein [Sphingomonadales bacterium]NCP25348.1 YeeE/YedE family protein [Sphingomonadales bacterium]NCP43903.1 YeeE/YedE family protein [Sphingomonadales bacterium]